MSSSVLEPFGLAPGLESAEVAGLCRDFVVRSCMYGCTGLGFFPFAVHVCAVTGSPTSEARTEYRWSLFPFRFRRFRRFRSKLSSFPEIRTLRTSFPDLYIRLYLFEKVSFGKKQ